MTQKCLICQRELTLYHFFRHAMMDDTDRTFFTTEAAKKEGVCFECAGPYRCLRCGEVKPASEYRVQGRICKACKAAQKRPVHPRSHAKKTRRNMPVAMDIAEPSEKRLNGWVE